MQNVHNVNYRLICASIVIAQPCLVSLPFHILTETVKWFVRYIKVSPYGLRARGGTVGWGTPLQARRLQVRFAMVSSEFFIDIFLPAALWPWVRLGLWQKWVPGMFPAGKCGWCVGLTILPPSCSDCLDIWEPQPPGTLRACPGLLWGCVY